MNYRAMAQASEGETTLSFDHVPQGRYAMQAFHDEDGSFSPDFPKEGTASSNDPGWPATFANSAFTVAGDTSITATMHYMAAPPAPTVAPAMHGVPAPDGATREDVRADGLNAILYRPAGDKPAPLIIMLGGSEGGLQAASGVGVSFVRHGYAVLALAYFMDEGLPQTLANLEIIIEMLKRYNKGVEQALVLLPQALRVIIPPLTSQYLNVTKNSSLAVAIGYPDVVSIANTALNQTGRAVECIAIVMAVYLTTSLATSLLMNWYNDRAAIKER